jgi:hypothetical protein
MCIWLETRTAWIATILFSLHPLHIYYSQELRNYSFLLFFGILSCYYLHRLLTEDTRRNLLLYACGMALAALSNFSAAFLYVIHGVIYLVRRGFSGKRVLRWLTASLIILVLISPWIYRIYVVIDVPKLVTPVKPGEISSTERLRGETTVTPNAIPYILYTFSAGFTLGPSTGELHRNTTIASVFRHYWPAILYVGVLFGWLSLAGAVQLIRRGLPWKQVGLYLFVPMALVFLLCWQNAKAINVRYVLISLPVYLGIIAVGLQSLRPAIARVLTVLVVLTLIFSLGNYYFNGRYAREDIRGAARYLEVQANEGECILAPTIREVFQYYYGKANPVHAIYAPMGTPKERIDAQLEKLFTACETVWYVRAREWADDADGYLLRALGNAYRPAEFVDRYDGVTLIKYE